MEKAFAYVASWMSWIADFCRPPNRLAREAVILILLLNTLEFKVALLTFQVQRMLFKA
jgi:hypothetical protein